MSPVSHFCRKAWYKVQYKSSQQILLNELEFEEYIMTYKGLPTQPLKGLQMAPILVFLVLRYFQISVKS